MATTIVTKSGSGAPTASDLVAGELAVDLTNGRLYTENSGGTVLELGLNPSGNVDVTGTVTATGTSVFASLDISGDIDVDGTTNLDVVDIDGAVDMASTLAVAGVVTANAGVVVDNITIDGQEIDVSSGDLTLDVAGNIAFDADGANVYFKDGGAIYGQFVSVSAGKGKLAFGNSGQQYIEGLDTGNGGSGAYLKFGYGATEAMRIDASGNVGIGTSSPTAPLTVNGTNAGIRFTDAGQDPTNYYGEIYKDYQGNAPFVVQSKSNGIGVIALNPDGGNVGIGTSSPSDLLHVSGASSPAIRVTATNTPVSVAMQADDATGFLSTVTNHPLVFRTNNAERMRIDADGRVTMPYQPAFNVNPTSDQNNIAIDSQVTVIFGTEVFDVGSNFASNTFTAPVTGKYQLNLALRLHNIDTAAAFYQIKFLTSNRSYLTTADYGGLSSDPAYWTEAFSVLADMDANDTVSITVQQSGGSVQTDIHVETTFSGYLVA